LSRCRPTPASNDGALPPRALSRYKYGEIRDSERSRSRAGLFEDHGPGGSERLLAKHISEEAAFPMHAVRRVARISARGIQHLPIIIGLRAAPPPEYGSMGGLYGTSVFLNLGSATQSMGSRQSERQKFIEKRELPAYRRNAGVLRWLDQGDAYDRRAARSSSSLVKCLRIWAAPSACAEGALQWRPGARLGNDLTLFADCGGNIEHIPQEQRERR